MAVSCQARQWCSTLALCRQDAQSALAGCTAGRRSQPPAALENRASSETPPVVPRILRRKPLVRCPGAPKHCRTKCQERPHRASGHAAAAREQRQGEAEMWGRKRSWVNSNGWALGWCIGNGCSGTTHMNCVDGRLHTQLPVHSLCVAEPVLVAQQRRYGGTTTTAGARLCTGPMARSYTCQQQLEYTGGESVRLGRAVYRLAHYRVLRFVFPSIGRHAVQYSTGPITTWILFRSKGKTQISKTFHARGICSPRPPSSQRCQRYCPAAPARRSAKGQPRSWYHRPSAPRFPPSTAPAGSTARVRPGVLAHRAVGHGHPHPFVRRARFHGARDGADHHLGPCRPPVPGEGCVM